MANPDDSDDSTLTRRQADRKFVRPTGATHVFRLRAPRVHLLEVEDVHFHHDSAVLLPDFDAAAIEPSGEVDRVEGLDVLVAGLRHAHANAEQKLLIVGHTDRSGPDDYNFQLSKKRADDVLHALLGNRSEWVAISSGQHKVEDYQQILKWVHLTFGWPCDPGPVDDRLGPSTRGGVRAFQERYNAEFGQSIAVDGVVGEETWGAIFDVYQRHLSERLGGDAELATQRASIQFLDAAKNAVGCGEKHPVTPDRASNYRSPADRRVELLFFDPGEEPELRCHPSASSCSPAACEIYPPGLYEFRPIPVTPTPRPTRTVALEVVRDENDDHAIDASDPVAEFVRFGIWDKAYDAAGALVNGSAETANFVGSDRRRFYFRVRDSLASGEVQITWKTLKEDRSDDDAPASRILTLLETSPSSHLFASRAVMLVTDDTDADQATDSGLPASHAEAGARNRGQSNHRLRRATMEGFVRVEYAPPGVTAATAEVPIFRRSPEERRRLAVRVFNYSNGGAPFATDAYIAAQFAIANLRWNQIGLKIEPGATTVRPIPAAALDASGQYSGSANNAQEQAALSDLIPLAADGSLTVVFVSLSGANAYATVAQRNPIPQPDGTTLSLQERAFIFIDSSLALSNFTLAHELAHVLFNRFDTGGTAIRFFPFNTTAPGSAPPSVLVYRRIQDLHQANPDNDPPNDNVINWARRARSARFPIADGSSSTATATTGNNLVRNF